MRNPRPSRTRASTSRSPSTVPRSGATRIGGSLRPSRILRPGARLLFETGSPPVMCCFPTDDDDAPADTRLHRDYFGMHRFEWRGPSGAVEDIDFRIGHGDMVRLLRSSG